jgi:ABC-type Mn2+/Zn2+ transport system permease subunit
MRHTTISGHHGTHHTVAAAFWILAGTIVLIAFGDVLTLLAVAFAIVTTVWWIYREVEHRVQRNDAEMAPVTHLRPALPGQRDLKKASAAHASWRGPSAA